jgi:hypothetical protein
MQKHNDVVNLENITSISFLAELGISRFGGYRRGRRGGAVSAKRR